MENLKETVQFVEKKLSELQRGDIFQYGKKAWDSPYRFHNLTKHEERYCISYMTMSYAGPVEKAHSTSFTWRNIDLTVYLPVYPLSDWKKSLGKPYSPGPGKSRYFFCFKLNSVNINA